MRQYVLSRSYSSATCRVVNVTYDGDGECKFCEGTVEKGGDRAASHSCTAVSYPCARVVVDFLVGGGQHVGRGVLYDDSMQASGDKAAVCYVGCRPVQNCLRFGLINLDPCTSLGRPSWLRAT